ncbi:MAG: diaminopimelate dehydrogenase [Elusimicrobia bacterium HGW-Elusimicrobia-2]|nr:MAG: diaminopimelate dehydrogenase [Elusimicrobia bacterium HGW-Elusimicrobia-2]
MNEKIRIAIVGYGNVGRGVEKACGNNPDMELKAVFTRRAGIKIASGVPAIAVDDAEKHKNDIDVAVLCGGSATDLDQQGPLFAKMFNTVDSFDTHAKIPGYFSVMDGTAKASGKIAVISTGWDPGLFSLQRVLAESVLPDGQTHTFWGRGVSQGHSDAVRRIEGVLDARQYTIPVASAADRVRAGEKPSLSTREKHRRDCYVVASDGADKDAIENAIKSMPNYFADYDTDVTFISREEMETKHSQMPHGGFVLRSGETAARCGHLIEFSLKLDSNPEFTSSVLVAYARAAGRLNKRGESGARTVFDIAAADLSPKSGEELRKELL